MLSDPSLTTAPAATEIKVVPPNRSIRETIRARVVEAAAELSHDWPLMESDIRRAATAVLDALGMPEAYLGWTMVMLGSAFWREQVVATPFGRRLLLLPHCLRNPDDCPAEFDQTQLQCLRCGRCRLTSLLAKAEDLGYQILIAEGSPVVMKMILEGRADAILGVSCLDVLERSLDRVLSAGIPSMAVPLHKNTCRETTTDIDWVLEMVETPHQPEVATGRSYMHLMRAATRVFHPETFHALIPPKRAPKYPAAPDAPAVSRLDPMAVVEAIGRDFLLAGGKRARPFVTLAAYDAMTGGQGTRPEGTTVIDAWPEDIFRVAAAIEVFHKASLVHDDIEDDDAFRYGRPTVHHAHDVPTAVNVGDYLIGLGYRLVADAKSGIGPDAAADILAVLAAAHTRLSEGQGAELAWQRRDDKSLTPLDALKIYALKTAPAFEAALFAGIRLAGECNELHEPLARFSRYLGTAFQIRNDLDDWSADRSNKLTAAGDVLSRRPTLLWAFALETLGETDRAVLASLSGSDEPDQARVDGILAMYERAEVFAKAAEIIKKQARRARETAETVHPRELRNLLIHLVEAILGAV